MDKSWDYNKIMSGRDLFNSTVYTKLSEARKILEKRQKNKKLINKIEKLLDNNIPQPLRVLGENGIQLRDVATPNHDTCCFIELTKDLGLKTIFLEYHGDKFTSNNDFKCSLGKLRIHNKLNRKKEDIEEKISIIDFNKCNGKPFKNIVTFWGEPLVDFHKKLFDIYGFTRENFIFHDNSDWLMMNGKTAENYYTKLLMLPICHGILFENFLLTGTEGEFSRKVLLPALRSVIELTGEKPLIVPIPPMDNENDAHWVSYKPQIKKLISSIKN